MPLLLPGLLREKARERYEFLIEKVGEKGVRLAERQARCFPLNHFIIDSELN